MNLQELRQTLEKEGISAEPYGIRHSDLWYVYYGEPGGERNTRIFNTEEEACAFLLDTVRREAGK